MPDIKPVQLASEHPGEQFRFLLDETANGQRCALVTIVGIVGTASRNLGSHMVVTEDGRFAGSVSSGCADASVAGLALEALESGKPRRVQLGAGSNFIDITLPCGGGVDLLITPDPDTRPLADLVAGLSNRVSGILELNSDKILYTSSQTAQEIGWQNEVFFAPYTPNLKLILAGRGSELNAFCRIACVSGYEVEALSPDAVDLEACTAFADTCIQLKSPALPVSLTTDPWTAIVLLFHDHDWEPPLLEAALGSKAFYIGALGSRKTHAARLEMMHGRGFSSETLNRIRGPIGLVPSMRNAPMLAISTLAEIVDVHAQASKRE